jgi:hypothetical protein
VRSFAGPAGRGPRARVADGGVGSSRTPRPRR